MDVLTRLLAKAAGACRGQSEGSQGQEEASQALLHARLLEARQPHAAPASGAHCTATPALGLLNPRPLSHLEELSLRLAMRCLLICSTRADRRATCTAVLPTSAPEFAKAAILVRSTFSLFL